MARPSLLWFTMAFALPLTIGSAFASGCGPSITATPQGGAGGGGSGAGGGSSTSSTTYSTYPWWDGGKDALPDYVDPGCPDAEPPPTQFDCDPYNQGNGDCAPEEGCFIYVEYPEGECAQEIYGALCVIAGFGGQGDPCNGGQDCGAGFVCVVSGSGNQCVKLCHIVGVNDCPGGYTCESIDVAGFGGCL